MAGPAPEDVSECSDEGGGVQDTRQRSRELSQLVQTIMR
jgi:hypothetical protein